MCQPDDELARVTIQRNKIHDPRYSANSWSDGHPAGPQAITLQLLRRQPRDPLQRDRTAPTASYFNDGIGGEDNFSTTGFPNADSDIYGNTLSHAWDDGIEAEGGNKNVRIWGNYIDRTAIGIATTVTSRRPGVHLPQRLQPQPVLSSAAAATRTTASRSSSRARDARSATAGATSSTTRCCRRRRRAATYGLGGGAGIGGTGSTQLINNTVLDEQHLPPVEAELGAFYQVGTGNDFDNDMYNGSAGRRRDRERHQRHAGVRRGQRLAERGRRQLPARAGQPGLRPRRAHPQLQRRLHRRGARRGRARGGHRRR